MVLEYHEPPSRLGFAYKAALVVVKEGHGATTIGRKTLFCLGKKVAPGQGFVWVSMGFCKALGLWGSVPPHPPPPPTMAGTNTLEATVDMLRGSAPGRLWQEQLGFGCEMSGLAGD